MLDWFRGKSTAGALAYAKIFVREWSVARLVRTLLFQFYYWSERLRSQRIQQRAGGA